MIYLSYFLGNVAILLARTKGWPTEKSPFKLGSWGMLVNVLALVWGGSMLVNFLWPRLTSNPPISGLPNIPGFLGPGTVGDHLPIFETTLVIIVVVGAIYYFFAGRTMPDTKAIQPAEAPA